MGDTQMMNKMELPMSIFVSATSREENAPDDDSNLQAAAFLSLRVVAMVVTVTTTITTPGRPTPYTIESTYVMNSWIIDRRRHGQYPHSCCSIITTISCTLEPKSSYWL